MRLVRELQGGPLTLEKYHRFFVDPWDTFITIDHLNLIIYMHGFNKLHRVGKKEIMGHLVGQVDMQPPRRSTLHAGALAAPTAASLITTDEAVADVDAIGWEECPIGCVAAFAVAVRGAQEPVEPTPRPADFVVTARGKRSKRRRSSAYGGCKRRGYAMKEEVEEPDEEEEPDDEDDDEWLPPPSPPPLWMRSPTPPPSPPPLWMRSPTPPPPPPSPPQTVAPPRPSPSPPRTVAPPPPPPPLYQQQEVAPHPPPFTGQQPTLVQQLSWGLPLPSGPLPPPAWPQGPAFAQHLPPGPTPYWSSPPVPLSHPAPFWGAPSVLPPPHMFWGRPPPPPPPPPYWDYHTSPSAPAMQQPPPPPGVQLQQWSPTPPGVGWGRPAF